MEIGFWVPITKLLDAILDSRKVHYIPQRVVCRMHGPGYILDGSEAIDFTDNPRAKLLSNSEGGALHGQ